MNKLALALIGATISFAATAQTSGSLLAGSSVVTTTVVVAAPIILLAAVVVGADENDTPSATATITTSTAP